MAIFTIPLTARGPGVMGPLVQMQGDIDTNIRVHVLKESARRENTDSADIARNLQTALSDATLVTERGILGRHLAAELAAEEAKKVAKSK